MSNYRPLTTNEIQQLESQSCTCTDWNLIEVATNFSSENIFSVSFSGTIRLGVFQKGYKLKSGIEKKSGIYNACIHNCDIADNVYINHITNQIANYSIGENCFLENIDLLETHPKASFGNGIKVAVLDETGSREVPIFEKLSSSTAYLLSTYKHNKSFTKALENLIGKYVAEKQSDIGRIEKNTAIKNCTAIINVNMGAYSQIDGVALLKNGTICSDADAPTIIGHEVIAKDFIICKGSKVIDGSQLEACFVGEACLIGKQFSAMHSLFFANCEMLHGEAVSIFAGPYTVSHHKSTLLIGGMFSFFNAGSGANMSNHMYKLGPIHYGVMQRGCKMASDSYLMWPGKIGAFSVVIGKIKKHIDSSALPFSYILDNKGEYSIMPAMNLTSVGTYRDSQKWIERDGRKNINPLDTISFDFLNPYIITKLKKGIEVLEDLKTKNPEAISISYKGCKIKAVFIKKGIALYQMMIDIYLGNCLLKKQLNNKKDAIEKCLDIGGAIITESDLKTATNKLIQGEYPSIENFNEALNKLVSKTIEANTTRNKEDIIKNAIAAQERYKNLLISDAQKEFSEEAETCFGLDVDENEKKAEFDAIRGDVNKNKLILTIEKQYLEKINLLEKL